MSRFTIKETPIKDLMVVERVALEDERGFLSRLFCKEALQGAGWPWPIQQVNHTLTRKVGVVRGMHYQAPPKVEAKLVNCIRGAVWDVAVDLRRDSPTFLKWHAEEISAFNFKSMLIPPGFAHGFQAMCEDSELIYFHSQAHDASCEQGLNPNDPILNILWPLKIAALSPMDAGRTFIDSRFQGVSL
jgi:dTDP-4-dehydrorhamnose 3,5-epimerase